MKHAIAALQLALDTAENNEPLNRAEGNIEQADLERDTANDLRAAIALLDAA